MFLTSSTAAGTATAVTLMTTAAEAATSPGKSIGKASRVPVGGSATFKDPTTGDPGIVLQPKKGVFVAFDATCTHAGCATSYQAKSKVIACPCHGSRFSPTTGAATHGPATSPLKRFTVTQVKGILYIK